MILVIRPDATQEQIDHVIERIEELGFRPHVSQGAERTIIGVIGDETQAAGRDVRGHPRRRAGPPILKPFKLASREFQKADSVVKVGKVRIGGGHLAMIAGPCAVESREGLDEIAGHVKKAGANILRGGAFKPRTSPYSLPGHGRRRAEDPQGRGRHTTACRSSPR